MNTIPTFGLISSILVTNTEDYILICEVLTTECFNAHFHSYEVYKEQYPDYVVVKFCNLADHYCLSLYTLSSHPATFFISLKYYLVDSN